MTMKKSRGRRWIMMILPCLAVLVIAATTFAEAITSDGIDRETYIVHMSKHHMPSFFASHEHWYRSTLKSVYVDAEEYSDRSILYIYDEVFHGFAAQLGGRQAEALDKMLGVLGVYPETVYDLHTTRSPEFLGLSAFDDRLPGSDRKHGTDVVVGVLDSGVWPESKSFDDRGMNRVPSRWKGNCQSCGAHFNSSHCNRKLIGARFFSNGYESAVGRMNETLESRSPRDDDGHGTHTATTAAGSYVLNASLFGYALGTARGMAPGARIAAYKVCWLVGCFSSDILAGMDRAVANGVNILSLSLGGRADPYYIDTVAVGAFTAVEKGIFVACAAGNAGPGSMSVANVAPWVATVGASTIDRDFPADVMLGNGEIYPGVSLYGGRKLPEKQYSLIYAANASNGNTSNLCLENTMDRDLVKGKMVLCDRGVSARVEKGAVVKSLGGVGMILANSAANGEELVADCHLLPATAVGRRIGEAVREYAKRAPVPTASIRFRGTVVGIKPSPVIAAFSSRGPNPLNPQILKPDIVAPGVNILAAWSGSAGPSGLDVDSRRVSFNIISGTSMSCPHISGIAALLKGAHPEWSPAAIKSALMTTAYTVDNAGKRLQNVATGNDSTPFDHGSGHVDPVKALAPGLIYDMGPQDYVDFLCALKYTRRQIAIIVKRKFTCSKNVLRRKDPGDINYPSFSVVFGVNRGNESARSTVVKYSRTVTNVGSSRSKYNVEVSSPQGVKIVVKPRQLFFEDRNHKRKYSVTFISKPSSATAASFGSITWSDGEHTVSSPVAFSWPQIP